MGRGPAGIHVDPGVARATARAVAAALVRARRLAGELLRYDVAPPAVFVYRDDAQLRDGACVHALAVAYYDGALHVSAEPHGPAHLEESIAHEYMHHVLTRLGVVAPAWLTEGVAMYAATEVWWMAPDLGLRAAGAARAPDFAAMVAGGDPGETAAVAAERYYRSLTMVQAVVHAGGHARLRRLVEALADGTLAPAAAFGWATGFGAADPAAAWFDAVARQDLMGGYVTAVATAP